MQDFFEKLTVNLPARLAETFHIIWSTSGWRDVVDVLIVAFVIYELFTLLRQSRTSQLLRGIVVVLAAYLLALILNLRTISFLMTQLLQFGLLAVVVVFQPEIRRALEQVGRSRFSSLFRGSGTSHIDRWRDAVLVICDSAEHMSKARTGALIVIETGTMMNDIVRTGTQLDADLSCELLETLFYEGSPLHDGAVIIRDARICAAGCLLPVSQNSEISKDMGTRHRAALGMSEGSDALIVVVSEETGIVSLAQNGVILRRLDRANLFRILEGVLVPKEDEADKGAKGWIGRFFKK